MLYIYAFFKRPQCEFECISVGVDCMCIYKSSNAAEKHNKCLVWHIRVGEQEHVKAPRPVPHHREKVGKSKLIMSIMLLELRHHS